MGSTGNIKYNVIIPPGCGKARAAAATQKLISESRNLDHILHFGVGGALDDSLEIGSLVIATKVIAHDVRDYFHPEKPLPAVELSNPSMNHYITYMQAKQGTIVSGDQDIVDIQTQLSRCRIIHAYHIGPFVKRQDRSRDHVG